MKHLITAGLPYINGIKHLGNLVGSMLPADVYARFLRQRGHDVLYVCATDEHGAPAEIAAAKAGQDVAAFCEEQHHVQADIYERFGLSFDHFGRSSHPHNHEITRTVFQQLDAHGLIERRAVEQIYSIDDKRFLPDRYVVGTCPHCDHANARGDQCENCTRLLDPTDLVDPRSSLSGSTALEVREAEHLFLKLAELDAPLRAWVEQQADWPALTGQIARKWLGEGLQSRCITRELKWGVSVPVDDLDLRFYVWFDAPIGYISATREWADAQGTPDAWKPYWIGGEDVRYTQFMGKDNLPFHTIMFPGMLLGGDGGWKLADQIKGFHWLDYYGGKFSTSMGRGIFTDVALELYPPDYWRYVLMANCPESADSTFTWELFTATVNKDLAGVLGNFVNRVLKFTNGKFGLEIPAGGEDGEVERKLRTDLTQTLAEYESAMEALQFRAAMRALRHMWTLGNLYIDARAPWSEFKAGNRDEAALIVRTCFNLIPLFANAAYPVIPEIAALLLTSVDLVPEGSATRYLGLDTLPGGRAFTVIPPAIAKISDDDLAALVERFGR